MDLTPYYSDTGPERVGVVLADGSVVELKNVHPEPLNHFAVSTQDILVWLLRADVVGTWHTHPGKDANLSVDDHRAFANWPKLRHHILGCDGLRSYEVDDRGLIRCV